MALLADAIEIQTLGENHVLTLPNEYEYSYTRPSVVGTNGVGQPFVQPLATPSQREWTLTWAVLDEATRAQLESAWDGLSSQVCRFEDIWGVEYSVVRHPEQDKLLIEEIKISGSHRWRVTMRMLQSSAAYEV